MDLQQPFETFQKSAFRLEALPQYLVDEERQAFENFKATGKLPADDMASDWAQLVKNNVTASKTMKRLRLISDKLTPYEQFELQIYSGLKQGEDIRVNSRHLHAKEYLYDFWFFDDKYIAQVHYESDGTFVKFDLRPANSDEKVMYDYWLSIFEKSTPLA